MSINQLCCDCGAQLDTHGEAIDDGKIIDAPAPQPGDATLCLYCAGLNIFTDEGGIRRPTDDEYIKTATNSDLQLLRKVILTVSNKEKGL